MQERAVIYARYSTDNQREESIDAQVRACREYCVKNSYAVIDVYKDEAKSGKSNAGRKDFNRMLLDAKKHKFDIIIFHKLDRGERNITEFYLLKATFKKLGIKYDFAVQTADDGTAQGFLAEGMNALIAEYYRLNLAEETKKGLKENALKSQFNGGVPLYGYGVDKNKNYVINEAEAQVVRFVFEQYLAGFGYNHILNDLESKGWRTRSGKPFSKTTIYDMLGNERYTGTYTYGKHPKFEGPRNMRSTEAHDTIRTFNAIPAIISLEDYQKVLAKRRHNKKRTAAFAAKDTYLLSGKVFCENCGQAMCGRKYKPRNTTYHYYACMHKERVADKICQQPQIQRNPVEKAVLEAIENYIFSNTAIRELSEHIRTEYYKIKNTGAQLIEEKEKAVAQLQRKKNNLIRSIENGLIDDDITERIKNIGTQLAVLNNEIKSLKDKSKVQLLTEEQIKDMLDYFKESLADNIDAKKILIETFLEKVTISNFTVTITLKTGAVIIYMVHLNSDYANSPVLLISPYTLSVRVAI